MIKLIQLLIISFLILGCEQGKPTENQYRISVNKNDLIKTKSSCIVQGEYLFSNNNQKDIFKLKYDCKNVEDSMLFQIFKSSGEKIYELKFIGADFYDYSRPWYEYVTAPKFGKDFDPEKLSPQIKDSLKKEDLKYLKKKVQNLFLAENFEQNPLEDVQYNLINEAYLDEFKKDSSIIGFSFCIGSVEGFQTIAYSRKQKKVLTIISSD